MRPERLAPAIFPAGRAARQRSPAPPSVFQRL